MVRRGGGMLTRKADVGIVVARRRPTRRRRLRKGSPAVTISGPIGECVLYLYGRKDVAEVVLDGPADAVAAVAAAPFGI